MVSPVLSNTPKQKFFDNNGVPLTGGKLFTYLAGTTTKQTTYTDSTGGTQNTNPIILDSRGEANIWLDPALSYKLVLAPSTDTDPPTNAIWTVDNITQLSMAQFFFTQTGAGAVQRTLQSKLADVYSVKDFGAKGDGATDDTAAFNAVVAAVNTAGGGSIYVPPGTYIISSSIVLPYTLTFLKLYGAGNDSILKEKSGASFDLITWNPPSVTYNYQQIYDLTLDGNSNTGIGNLINTAGMGGMEIRNLHMQGIPASGSGIVTNGKSAVYNHDVRISNIYIDTTTGFAGINVGGLASDTQIDNVIVQGRSGLNYGIYFNSGAAHVRVTECHFYNCTIAQGAVTTNADSLWFSDCTFDAGTAATYNFYAISMTKCSFTGCQFTYSIGSTDLITLSACTDNSFTNCLLEAGGATRWGINETGASDRNVFNQSLSTGAFSSGLATFVGASSSFSKLGQTTILYGNYAIGAGSTAYVSQGIGNATEFNAEIIAPYDGFIRLLKVGTQSAPGSGKNMTATVRLNGVSQSMVATVSGASGFNAVAQGFIVIPAGAAVDVMLVNDAGAASNNVLTTLVLHH